MGADVNAADQPDMPRLRRALLIINENSRQGREGGQAAIDVLESGGIHLQRETCHRPDDLADIIRRTANSVDLVVLGGGDGTLSSAAPALMETGLPLGILPLGTANDLARTLGIPPDLAGAAQVIVEARLRRIDLGEVNGKPFFNVASMGLSVGMTRELTHDVKQRWGKFGYAVATFRALWHMRPFSAAIRSGDELPEMTELHAVEIETAVVDLGSFLDGHAAAVVSTISDGYLECSHFVDPGP